MYDYNKVVWTQGLLISPHHFQQQERYLEYLLRSRTESMGYLNWGLYEFKLDTEMLKLGKISIARARGVFQDGTPFSIPDEDDSPQVIELPEKLSNTIVYLALPLTRPGITQISYGEDQKQGLARYQAAEYQATDVFSEQPDTITVNVGRLKIQLLTQDQDRSGYTTIGAVKVKESNNKEQLYIDEQYIPPCTQYVVSYRLSEFAGELHELIHNRAEALAARIADPSRMGHAELTDFLMLQVLNRLEPLADHIKHCRGLHPFFIYTQIVQMAGELCTFVERSKRTITFAAYNHEDLQQTFYIAIEQLRKCLGNVLEATAISLTLKQAKFGIQVSPMADRSLLTGARFVLAVKATMAVDALHSRFPQQAKVGAVEEIRTLVNSQLPGINLRLLPVAPREIPFKAGFSYFELDTHCDPWKRMGKSNGFAIHIGEGFPGIELEFWAIRD